MIGINILSQHDVTRVVIVKTNVFNEAVSQWF